MSVNIGNDAVTAIHELRGNPHFERLIAALGAFSQTMMISAIDADVVNRTDKTAYARGFYHLWQAMHSAHTGLHMSQVKPPALTRNSKALANAE